MGFQYMKLNSELPAYYQFPEFLLNMELSQTARIIYMLLYERARLSQKNGWLDESGNVFIVFPLKEISKASDRSLSAVKCAMSDLESAGLLRRESAGFSRPNHLYVRIPLPGGADTTGVTKRAFIKPGNNTSDGWKTGCTKGGLKAPSKVIEKSNKNKNTGVRHSCPDYSCEEGESL